MDSIKSYIDQVHNPKLVQPEESPNGNIIYHIYCDGEITSQKGGWAYLQRSEFTDSYALSLKKKYFDIFPIKGNGRYSYAIVTEKDAKSIRNMMIEVDKE
jgi:hypothetical protein